MPTIDVLLTLLLVAVLVLACGLALVGRRR
jgi:hypothetical protein